MENNEKLKVTAVNVYPFKKGSCIGNIKGLATIVISDQFQVRGLRIVDGQNRLFVGYPCDPFYKGEDFRTICQPVTSELRELIENKVLEAYQKAVNDGENKDGI